MGYSHPEAGRHNPDHDRRPATDWDGFAKDGGVRPESPLPVAVTQDDDGGSGRRFAADGRTVESLRIREDATQGRLNSEDAKQF